MSRKHKIIYIRQGRRFESLEIHEKRRNGRNFLPQFYMRHSSKEKWREITHSMIFPIISNRK